ncbi:MAG: AMP-binding protein, partial [Elusimicrobia bacterium]|nr:AMP-binding protein [Elusimicrobiota bacterium]
MTRTLTNPYKSKLLANPDELAALVYTSGSTGEPKAIRFTHRQILTAVQAIGGVFPELSPGDHTLSWLPLAHQFPTDIQLGGVGGRGGDSFCGRSSPGHQPRPGGSSHRIYWRAPVLRSWW